MEGAGKGGPKPQQQNKPKQNKPQQNQNKKGGGGGGNTKGEKKPGNPNAGGPKLQKTETSEIPSAEPAKVSIEVTSPTPVAEEVKPTSEVEKTTPQVEKPTPQPNLLPEQPVGEGKNVGKGNQQGKRNASKSPAKGGHQNKNPNAAAKNAQGPPAIPPRAGEKSEGMVPDVEAQVAKETVAERGNTSEPVPIAPQLSLSTEQSKETARGKSPSKNNQNPKGGKGNKSGNPPNKNASQPPAVPPRSNQPAPAPGKGKNPTIQQPVEGTESSSVETPKAAGAGCPDPKNNAQGKNSQNSPKKSKSQAKGGGGSPPLDDPLKSVPQSTPVETTIPVEIPQSFAEKAKSPAPKGSDKVQAEKARADSPAKSEQTQSKNKAGKNGSTPQTDKSLVEVPPAAPQELPSVEPSAVVMPGNIDLPKNQQSLPSTPSPVEQKECELKNSQKNKNQKKQSAKTPSPPKADKPPLGASSAPTKEPTQAVAGEDFEPLFSDLSNPVAKPSQPAPKESPKQGGKETVDEIFKTPGAGGPAEKEALKTSVAEPPKPLVQEKIKEPATEIAKTAAKETQKPAAKETPNPGVKETQKPAAKETPKPAAKETPKPAAKETPKPTIQETPKSVVKEAPKPTLTALQSEDADFDPLFSDLTDSTKALVGIACPFVDKFPPLTPPVAAPKATTPEPKHQSPVGTPGTEPKGPPHQSKKSKSPPNKALPPQSSAQAIPKSAPVEIEVPSAGSPLQGSPTLPDSWRDKVMSDVKLSSSPKRSASPKLSSSPKAVEVSQKKEDNKNQGNGKKVKPQAPLDPNEPTKVTPAVAVEVPLKPEEPKSDANEHKVDKKVGNQKPSPPKVTRAAQDAPKAPVDKKEDGARSTKLQKGNPTPPEPTNQPIQRPAPKKETIPPKNTPNFPTNGPNPPTNGPNPELTPKKKRTFKGTKKDRKNKKEAPTQNGSPLNSLAGEVAKARQHIKNSLQCIDDIANMTSPSAVVEVSNRLNTLEKENTDLKQKVGDLTALLAKLEVRVKDLEKGSKSGGMQVVTQNTTTVASQAVAKATHAASQASANVKTAGSQVKTEPAKQEDDDDGVDLFGSDSEEEDEEANKIKEQRRAEYAAKKAKKPALIAKSSIILDVKPWDDETNMVEMEKHVRKIEADGLLWGASKLVPLAYGIHKLQINCVVEDEKISIDWLQETIEEIQDFVQSVDIAAFNKI